MFLYGLAAQHKRFHSVYSKSVSLRFTEKDEGDYDDKFDEQKKIHGKSYMSNTPTSSRHESSPTKSYSL